MRTSLVWADTVQDKNGEKQPIYSVAFSPLGSVLIASAGSQVLVYDTSTGELIQALKAHKDTVYCVDYSPDGKRFASGGADKQVVIWSEKLEGILKYSHNDPIQALAHNPVSGLLVSCSTSDIGLWSPEQKAVTKFKVPSKVLCCSWTSDGQFFALGMYNGTVSIRNKTGEEKVRIERSTAPIWTLSWNPSLDSDYDILAIGDWTQKLSFFQLSGRQVGKDKILGFDPCASSYFPHGQYLAIGGSDRKVTLWTNEGIKLGQVCEKDNWVWSCKVNPKNNMIAVGTQDGTLSIHQVSFNTVHGLYRDRYAFRENMTDVVIQHLTTDQRARIKCRDYIKRIAVYKDRLAVQLSDRIIIYELFHDDETDMHYRIKEKISQKLDCNQLVVTSSHVVLCLDKKLQAYSFSGEKEREWNLEANIRYIKVIGGKQGQEGVLVGLKNGQVLQIFLNNPFPIPRVKIPGSIRCLDLNMTRTKLAVVDDQNMCNVYDMKTNELIFQEPNAASVAWNSELEDMLTFSGNGQLNIKAGNFPPHTQRIQGFVVGFKGSRVFCLNGDVITSIDVPQSASLDRYLEKKDFTNAYQIASLGVPESDWKRFAGDALEALEIGVAKRAFMRMKDLAYLELIRNFERQRESGKADPDVLLADIAAYTGKYAEAAKLYRRSGQIHKAIEMYTELNLWEQATQLAEETNADTGEILKRKAQMHHDRNDLMAAASTYIEVGEYLKAIEILGPNGAVDKLIEVARKVNKSETKALGRCVAYFRKHRQHAYAAETLIKMGDIAHLLQLHVELQHWNEAFKTAEEYPEFANIIYVPYANYLAMNDKFVEAQEYYRKAGRLDEAYKVMGRLTDNAVTERRFDDAGYFYWMLAREILQNIPGDIEAHKLGHEQKRSLAEYHKFTGYAQVYYAFHVIQQYIDEPFTSHTPESVFNMARFIYHYSLSSTLPTGVSKSYVLYALAKLGKSLKSYKVSRQAYEKLQSLRIPPTWQDTIDLGSLTIRSKPISDDQELSVTCPQCSASNPLINPKGNRCMNCQEPFMYSFFSFDMLPLVRFVPEDGVTDSEAERCIFADPPLRNQGTENQNQDSLTIGEEDEAFKRQIMGFTRASGSDSYQPIKANKEALLSMSRHDVFIRKFGKKCLQNEYYRIMNPQENSVVMCKSCQFFFVEEEWTYQVLQKGACPFCRKKTECN